MNKVQTVHDYYEILHAGIQFTIFPTEDDMDAHFPSIDINQLRYIYQIWSKRHFTKLDISFSSEDLPTELIRLTITANKYNGYNPEEQALVNFTRINLKRHSLWDEWKKCERNQLHQIHDLRMFGKPINVPKNEILLRPHYQYAINRSGTCRARQCCDGYKRSAPKLI